MNMFKQAVLLWKQEKGHKGTSLQRRLLLFFVAATVFILLSFVALLLVFGITGSESFAVKNYMDTELSHIYTAFADHSGQLSVQGVAFSEQLSQSADVFFEENSIKAQDLPEHPELLEPLLTKQMPHVLSMMDRSTCSGTFILLDATVQPEAENAATQKSGVFIKKTRHNTKQAVGAKQ